MSKGKHTKKGNAPNSTQNSAPNNAPNNNNVIVPPVFINGNGIDTTTQNQGIRFIFAQDDREFDDEGDFPTLAATIPFQTNIGDRVKLDAMVQIEVFTDGDDDLAARSTVLRITRSTQLLGQDTPVTETVVQVTINDEGINNPELGISYSRLASITWVDTPPAGITTYTFRVAGSGNANIQTVRYSNRALNAIIFPIGSSLI